MAAVNYAEQPSTAMVLLSCVIAGIGLALTNSPTTNTTTGAVSNDRAGMASGIDFSARLITLALNIALMGLVLLWGSAITWPMYCLPARHWSGQASASILPQASWMRRG